LIGKLESTTHWHWPNYVRGTERAVVLVVEYTQQAILHLNDVYELCQSNILLLLIICKVVQYNIIPQLTLDSQYTETLFWA